MIDVGMLQEPQSQKIGKLTVPNTMIEMKGDSVYYSILSNMI
mgnify:FL=1